MVVLFLGALEAEEDSRVDIIPHAPIEVVSPLMTKAFGLIVVVDNLVWV